MLSCHQLLWVVKIPNLPHLPSKPIRDDWDGGAPVLLDSPRRIGVAPAVDLLRHRGLGRASVGGRIAP